MENFRKIALVVYYFVLWLLFVFCLLIIVNGLTMALMGTMKKWYIFISFIVLALLFSYLLRFQFKKLIESIKSMKNFLSHNWFKLGILFIILIIALAMYQTLVVIPREKITQQRVELMLKSEQEKKDYDSKQKTACLDIYQAESKKWNNVNGWRYDSTNDRCYIEYKASPKKTEAQCDAEYKGTDGKVSSFFFMEWLQCKDGLFEKSF